MNKIVGIAALALVFPVAVGAQSLAPLNTIVTEIGDIVNLLVPIAFAAAVLFFIWGLATFILASGDEEAKTAGKNRMIYGILALFVIAAVWGIVAFLGNLVGINTSDDTAGDVPAFN